MSEEILVNVTPQETRVAVLAAGQVQELVVERAASRGLVGNIYVGRVARVLPGMQSAFVEIGLERSAFLHVADIWGHRKANDESGRTEPGQPIEKYYTDFFLPKPGSKKWYKGNSTYEDRHRMFMFYQAEFYSKLRACGV